MSSAKRAARFNARSSLRSVIFIRLSGLLLKPKRTANVASLQMSTFFLTSPGLMMNLAPDTRTYLLKLCAGLAENVGFQCIAKQNRGQTK